MIILYFITMSNVSTCFITTPAQKADSYNFSKNMQNARVTAAFAPEKRVCGARNGAKHQKVRFAQVKNMLIINYMMLGNLYPPPPDIFS